MSASQRSPGADCILRRRVQGRISSGALQHAFGVLTCIHRKRCRVPNGGVGSVLARVALLVLAIGCATPLTDTPAPERPGVERLVVCAPNTVLPLASELQGGRAPLQREVEAYLIRQGREVVRIDLYDGRELWTQAVAQAREEGAIENAVAIFADALAEYTDFHAIVMPSLLLTKTLATASWGTWDGVTRRMRTVDSAEPSWTGRSGSVLDDGTDLGGLSGEMSVTSVHFLVFSRDGERIFEGRGGLEYTHEIDLSKTRSHNRLNIRMRDDLFEDPEVLREGIEIGLTPYLTSLAER